MYDVCMHVVQIHLYQILYVTICSLVQLIPVTDLIVLVEFAASFYGGAIGIWSVKSNKGPEKITYPHGNHLL